MVVSKRLLAVVFVLAVMLVSANAVVITVKGDLNNVVAPSVPKSTSMSVEPKQVPRFCDVSVHSVPGVQVNVYSLSNVYTGISCTTDGNGYCSFRFGLTQPPGMYVVRVGDITERLVKLDPSLTCYKDISEFDLTPDEVNVSLGETVQFNLNALDENGVPANVQYRVELSDPNNGNYSVSGTTIEYSPAYVGDLKLNVFYGDKEDSSLIHVKPGKCSHFIVQLPPEVHAGENFSIGVKVLDDWNNTKPEEGIGLRYVDPTGDQHYISQVTNDDGYVEFNLSAGEQTGLLEYSIITNGECANTTNGSIEVLPADPRDFIILPEIHSLTVGQIVNFRAHLFDEYGNEIHDYNLRWSSSNSYILRVYNDGLAVARFPGNVVLTATATYEDLELREVCFAGSCFENYVPVEKTIVSNLTIRVENGKPQSIVITPLSVDVPVNNYVQFIAKVYDEYGAVISNPSLNWSSSIGNINAYGLWYSGLTTGVGKVRVSYGNLSAEADVEVLPGNETQFYFPGAPLRVHDGDQLEVEICAKDQYGNPAYHRKIQVSADRGSVTPSLIITDSNGCGKVMYSGTFVCGVNDTLEVRDLSNGYQDSVEVSVYLNPPVVKGYVLDVYGNPVDGATVSAGSITNVSDSTGYYELHLPSLDCNQSGNNLIRKPIQIEASKNRYSTDSYKVVPTADRVYNHDFQLTPYSYVFVLVQDTNNLPIENANVSISEGGQLVVSGRTDPFGYVTLGFIPSGLHRMYRISVNARYYDPSFLDMVISPGDSVSLVFTLGGFDDSPPVLTFVGDTPADGDAVNDTINVSVYANDPHFDNTTILVNGNPVKVCNTPRCDVSVDTTNYPDGEMNVTAVGVDQYGSSGSISRTFNVDNVPPVILVEQPTPANNSDISGSVVLNFSATDDTGITGMEIYINGSLAKNCPNADNCSYEWNVSQESGSKSVVVVAYGQLTSSQLNLVYNVTPTYYQALLKVYAVPNTIEPSDSSRIYVELYDNHGNPMGGVQVDVSASDGSVLPNTKQTDASGKADFTYSPNANTGGSVLITAMTSQISNTTTVYVVDLNGNGDIRGTVTDNNGNPLANAEVNLYQNGAKLFTANTDANGIYSITVPAGYYDVEVVASGYSPAYENGVLIEANKVVVKDYQLSKLAKLFGYVTNESGVAIENATVSAYRNSVLVASTQTDGNGFYDLDLVDGVYYVEITHSDYLDASYTVYLPPEGMVQKDVVMYR